MGELGKNQLGMPTIVEGTQPLGTETNAPSAMDCGTEDCQMDSGIGDDLDVATPSPRTGETSRDYSGSTGGTASTGALRNNDNLQQIAQTPSTNPPSPFYC